MKPNYRVLAFDLAVARNIQEPIDGYGNGASITAITVQSLPVGATVNLSIGRGGDAIPLTMQGQTFRPENFAINTCPKRVLTDEGFSLENAATAGVLVLIVSSGDGDL